MSSVLVVDDSAFMRNLLTQLLEDDHDVVGEAENGVEAVGKDRELDPDIVTMDVVMPIRDGIEATGEIKAFDPDAAVIMCTSVGQEEKMRAAGGSLDSARAKLVGGSEMFAFSTESIGPRNVEAAKRALADGGVRVVASDVGGDYGRSVRLRGSSGELVVRSAKRGERAI